MNFNRPTFVLMNAIENLSIYSACHNEHNRNQISWTQVLLNFRATFFTQPIFGRKTRLWGDDVGFGTCTSLSRLCYTLWHFDRFSRLAIFPVLKVTPEGKQTISIALYNAQLISKALRYGPCVTKESHSFTCHPHTNHTCLYSPAARHHRPYKGTPQKKLIHLLIARYLK